MDELHAMSRRRNPERYAPDGTPLLTYDGTCRHERLERSDGCGDRWQHRLEAWRRAQQQDDAEPEIPDVEEERAMAVEEPVDRRDAEQPYARVRGEA